MRKSFSLLELLIVIGIIAMVSVVVLKRFSGSYGSGDRVVVKNQIIKSFAEARLKAKMSGRAVALNFEDDEGEKQIRIDFINAVNKEDPEEIQDFEEEPISLPETCTWATELAETFVFYPDGEATGAEFVVEADKSTFRIQVDRLNSQLIIDEE